MAVSRQMFGSLMEHKVVSNVLSSLVVAEESNRLRYIYVEWYYMISSYIKLQRRDLLTVFCFLVF